LNSEIASRTSGTFDPLSIYEGCNIFGDIHATPCRPREATARRTIKGGRRDFDTALLLPSFFAPPLVPFKIMAAIHWKCAASVAEGRAAVAGPPNCCQ
jgi:hypothetical protein